MGRIGERVLDLIRESGMTQKEFSSRTGIPQSTISDWRGKGLNPSSDKLAIICEVLNIDPAVLISGSGLHKYEKEQTLQARKGSMEYELVAVFNQLTPAMRDRLLAYAYALRDIQNESSGKAT